MATTINRKSIEKTYVKVNLHQHVLEKPGMYIGEIKQTNDTLWVSENGHMVKKEVSYSSGFLKIFDEILVNALDHSKRDPTVSAIKIDIDPKEGKVSVWNNGEGIPVEQHPEHKKYIPELIFGDLLTSSNYDKNEERTWGGTNGLGAKCVAPFTNIRTKTSFFKRAYEINTEDVIYGEDMKEVNVLNTSTGYGRMYRIKENNGEYYDVNDNHLLTLLFVGKIESAEYQRIIENSTYVSERIFDISVKNFIELDTRSRSTLHGVDAFYRSLGPIHVAYLGLGRYICLRVDGGHRFLVNNLTLTHNCTNIYSTKFIVETADGKNSFYQSYTKNMYNRTLPLIKKSTKKYTKITFYPDFDRFEMTSIDDAMLSIMHKRVYDLIATTSKKISVYLNGVKIEQKSFREYISLFPIDQENVFISQYISPDEKYHWDVAICPSEHYEQISFVNGISTTKGGKHVDYILSLVLKKLCSLIETKKKQTIRPSSLKDRMMIFVSCTVPSPSFSSQSKEELTTNQKFFGCKPDIPDSFIMKLFKSRITDDAIAISNLKLDKEMTKTDGKKKSRITGIPKLDDAGYAGTKKSHECTLILTEGDSAKSSAIAGVSALPNGKEYYGIMPLRGKVLNVREATQQQILKNEEILNIKKIMGLVQGKEYKDTSELRYGRILIFSDADEDGAHIRSLVVNLFAHWWPELLKLDGFLNTLRSPILKAKSLNNRKPTLEFFTLRDYNEYIQSHPMDGYKIKYYKGLGTLETPEVKECFKKIKENTIKFVDNNSKESHEAIKLAFEKTQADNRKKWLQSFDPNMDIDSGIVNNQMTYKDLINKELIHFSLADVKRSIPCVVDGLKPSQRKALYGCFKKFTNKNEEIKVVQLANYIAENTAYHHGDSSMNSTVISMAFNFVGSNNMNLLEPIGQFGTRLQGGKDTAQPRYIFTRLEKHTFDLFPSQDFPVLNYVEDDGQVVEPEYYTPVLPMVLVNGALGIGTGYSTYVAQYNPKELMECVKMKIQSPAKCQYPELKPWYKNFKGEIVDEGDGRWGIYGKMSKDVKTKCIHITELPVGTWTQDYIIYLEKLMEDTSSGVNYYKNLSDESNIDIRIYFNTTELFTKQEQLHRLLKLYTTISTNNMHLFNSNGKIQKYNSVYEIIDEFVEIRLQTNQKRKDYQLKELSSQLTLYNARYQFVQDILDEKIKAFRVSKEDIIKQLQKLKYTKQDGSFNYLLNMPIHSFSKETLQDLQSKCVNTRDTIKSLKSKTIQDLYMEDILKLKI